MEIEKIAELISEKLYNPTETDTDFAFQLLIEKLIVPDGVCAYSKEDMKKWIINALSK
jgi:hypothetical protein